ncbi:AsmA family protein [Roseomonas sp. ACRSG]|nr:AsmA family protein [Roseomonas sp. ACRSG]
MAVPLPPRRRRGRRALIALAVVVAVPLAGYATLRVLLRGDVLRPRLIAAVHQATGRDLTLSGPIGLKLSLVPTVTLEGVTLSNAPGGSRPEMLTARRVEARLALIPLLSRRLAFEQVTLIEPDLLLERDAQGRGNWVFAPPPPAEAPTPAPSTGTPAAPAAPLQLSVAAIGIQGGRLSWRDAGAARAEVLDIRDLLLRAESPEAPITFEGQLALRDVPLAVQGQAGPLPRLLGTTASPENWPLRLTLAAPGVQVVLDGSASRPEAAAGWQASLNATADRADRLAPFLRQPLPPMSGLDIHAELADGGPGGAPRLLRLQAKLASADLSAQVPELHLGSTTLTASDEGPTELEGQVEMRGVSWQAAATLPPVAVLRGSAPWPASLALRGEGVSASAVGTLSGAERRQLTATVSVQAADTAPLLRSFGLATPLLHDLRLDGRISRDGKRLEVQGLQLQSRDLVLQGDASLDASGPRPKLVAGLTVPRLNLDALSRAQVQVQPQPAQPSATVPAVPPVPAPPAAPPLPSPPAAATDRLIPALPLPVDWMRTLDAELRLAVGDLKAGRVLYRDQRATMTLADGQMAMAPVSLGIPGGRVALSLHADATATPPRFALSARHEGQGIELQPLLQAYRLPDQSSGQVELEADLAGQGADTRALTGSLNGQFALAMANGQVGNALLDRFLGDLRRMLGSNGGSEAASTPLRCFALRLGLREGVARPEAMLLESGLADVAGSGEIDLGQERLNLRLLPQVRLGSLGLSAPVKISGSFLRPVSRLEQGGAAQAAAGIAGELAARQKNSGVAALGQLAEVLAGRPGLPDCAQQLAVARGGRPGPVPPPETRSEQRRPNAVDVLRGLLGR